MSHIIVIDDDEPIRESFKKLIQLMGHEVTAFSSAEDFLDAELPVASDLCVIVDLFLNGGMNAIEMMKEMKRINLNLPTILLTGDITSDKEALEAGAIEVLGKPTRREDLERAINNALGR